MASFAGRQLQQHELFSVAHFVAGAGFADSRIRPGRGSGGSGDRSPARQTAVTLCRRAGAAQLEHHKLLSGPDPVIAFARLFEFAAPRMQPAQWQQDRQFIATPPAYHVARPYSRSRASGKLA